MCPVCELPVWAHEGCVHPCWFHLMPGAWLPVSGSLSVHWSFHSPLHPRPSGAQGTGRRSSNLPPVWSLSWCQCCNPPQANPGEPGQRETRISTAGWGWTARGVGVEGAPPTQGLSPMTYPRAKQSHRPACDFWSASSRLLNTAALKKRRCSSSPARSQSSTVFILTEAIYSIIAIFRVLFYRVFVDYSLQIKQRNSVTAFELKYNDPFVSQTVRLPGTDSALGNICHLHISKYLCPLILIDDSCDRQDSENKNSPFVNCHHTRCHTAGVSSLP